MTVGRSSTTSVYVMDDVNSPGRVANIRNTIQRKAFLRRFYAEAYKKYLDCLQRCPKKGCVFELGSGGGFAATVIPELITSDILPYQGIDCVVDAEQLPLPDNSVRLFCMMNVFHHIPDVRAFLREAQRCLTTGGRLFIIDQHVGHISRFILRYFHHEPFSPDAAEWHFESRGPLSGANGALAWLVFRRDRGLFESKFKHLKLLRYEPHTPLGYWISGGLHGWSLLPGSAVTAMNWFDRLLIHISENFGSFVDIEVVKV